MDDSQKSKLKDKILSDIDATTINIEQLKEQAKPVPPDNAIGRISRMEALGAQGLSEVNLRKAEVRLRKLQHALERIDDEYFGICRECDQPIPEKRLFLVPEVEVCVACLATKSA